MSRTAPEAIGRVRAPVQQALRAAVGMLDDERMRLIASYQLGWCDQDGNPVGSGGGKAIRPTLAVLSAEAGGGSVDDGLPGAVAVELTAISNGATVRPGGPSSARARRSSPATRC